MTASNFFTTSADYGGGLFQLINQKSIKGSTYLFSDIIKIVDEEINSQESAEVKKFDWIQPAIEIVDKNDKPVSETELMNLLIQAAKEPERFFEDENSEKKLLINEEELKSFLEKSGICIDPKKINKPLLIQFYVENATEEIPGKQKEFSAPPKKRKKEILTVKEPQLIPGEIKPISCEILVVKLTSEYNDIDPQVTEKFIQNNTFQIKISSVNRNELTDKSVSVKGEFLITYSVSPVFQKEITDSNGLVKSIENISYQPHIHAKIITLDVNDEKNSGDRITSENSEIKIPILDGNTVTKQTSKLNVVQLISDEITNQFSNQINNEIKIAETPGNLLQPGNIKSDNPFEFKTDNTFKLKTDNKTEFKTNNPPELKTDNPSIKIAADLKSSKEDLLAGTSLKSENENPKLPEGDIKLSNNEFNKPLLDQTKTEKIAQLKNEQTPAQSYQKSEIKIDGIEQLSKTFQKNLIKEVEVIINSEDAVFLTDAKKQTDEVLISSGKNEKHDVKAVKQSESIDIEIEGDENKKISPQTEKQTDDAAKENDLDKRSSNNNLARDISHKIEHHTELNIENTSIVHQIKNNELITSKENHPETKLIHVSDLTEEIKSFFIKNDKSGITLKLTPEHLGKVKLLIDVHESSVTAKIEVENESVQQVVNSNIEQLRQSFIQNGLQLTSFTVSLLGSENKYSNKPESRRKYHTHEIDLNSEAKSESIKIKKMGYNTYEFLA